MLEQNGLIARIVEADTKPVRVSYALTEKGEDFEVIMAALKSWGAKWGGVKTKLCRSFACIHDSVPMIDLNTISDRLLRKTK